MAAFAKGRGKSRRSKRSSPRGEGDRDGAVFGGGCGCGGRSGRGGCGGVVQQKRTKIKTLK